MNEIIGGFSQFVVMRRSLLWSVVFSCFSQSPGSGCFYPFAGSLCFIDEPLLAGGKSHVQSVGHPGASVNTEIIHKNK